MLSPPWYCSKVWCMIRNKCTDLRLGVTKEFWFKISRKWLVLEAIQKLLTAAIWNYNRRTNITWCKSFQVSRVNRSMRCSSWASSLSSLDRPVRYIAPNELNILRYRSKLATRTYRSTGEDYYFSIETYRSTGEDYCLSIDYAIDCWSQSQRI